MQKAILVSADGASRVLDGDPEKGRLDTAGASTRVLPILLGEGWRISTVSPSTSGFLIVVEKS